ncbi:MAG: hypothetical protein QNJ06_20865 [Kiloniellales bacterium]|nr:hypothetical protein [Kiloniellales bacterium]
MPAVKAASTTLTAQEASVTECLALIAWGIGAEETKNPLANLDSPTKGGGVASRRMGLVQRSLVFLAR